MWAVEGMCRMCIVPLGSLRTGLLRALGTAVHPKQHGYLLPPGTQTPAPVLGLRTLPSIPAIFEPYLTCYFPSSSFYPNKNAFSALRNVLHSSAAWHIGFIDTDRKPAQTSSLAILRSKGAFLNILEQNPYDLFCRCSTHKYVHIHIPIQMNFFLSFRPSGVAINMT
jgi:hypothetical protein